MNRIYILLGAMLMGFACRNDMTAPISSDVQLSAEDVAVTEAWLRVHITPTLPHDSIRITRNDTTVLTLGFQGGDTLLIDEQLSPKKAYSYKLYSFGAGKPNLSSETLTFTTMDTTSHDFTWQIDTLGDGASSQLNDVAIINDTLAYAVGQIYFKDSTGQFDPTAYNVAKWNGIRWQLLRIQFLNFCNQPTTYSYPAKAVFAFSATDIWVTSGSQFVRWNGLTQTSPQCIPVSVNKLWGESENLLYAVGVGGGMALLNGGTWQKLNSGTTLDIQDIWGAKNDKTGKWEVMAVAGNYYASNERKVLSIADFSVSSLSDNGIPYALNSVWFSPRKHYWVVGAGIYEKSFTLDRSYWKGGLNNPITTYTTNRIRGTQINDVFFCGADGDLFHFNGLSWHSYRSESNLSNGQFLSIAVKGNTIIAVGYDSPRAIVMRGKRISPNN
jgi:hypothetical protein